MSQPTPPVLTTAHKAWIATIGSLIVAQLPAILQFLGKLPAPYGLIFTGIGMALSGITGRATYGISNKPK